MAKKSLKRYIIYVLLDSELQIRSDSKLAILIQGYYLIFPIRYDVCYKKKRERESRGNVRVGICDVLYFHLCGQDLTGL